MPADGTWTEARLRMLHDLLPAALEFPEFAVPYTRFLRAMRERLHPLGARELRTVKTPSGLSFVVNVGERLGADFYYGYRADFFEAELLVGALRAGWTVVDVGANFGFYTLSAAAKVGTAGKVYAIEPDPSAFELLETNVRDNGCSNVWCQKICLSDHDGSVTFHIMEESAFSGIEVTGRSRLVEERTIPVRRLDGLLAEAGIPSVGAIKIDVEGHEFAVLQGGRETIRSSPEVIILLEVNQKNLDARRRSALQSELQDLYRDRFRGWLADGVGDGIRQLRDPGEAAAVENANILLVRRASETEDRLREVAAKLQLEAAEGLADEVMGVIAVSGDGMAEGDRGVKLLATLFGQALKDHEARIRSLRHRLAETEGESQVRLQESERHLAETVALRKTLEAVEDDSRRRLEELENRTAERAFLRERLQAVEDDSRLRLEELEKRNAETVFLRERLKASEDDSQQRLEQLTELVAEVTRLREQLEMVEVDSQRRLEELRKRSAEVALLRERLQAIEEDSQTRRAEWIKTNAQLQALRAGMGGEPQTQATSPDVSPLDREDTPEDNRGG